MCRCSNLNEHGHICACTDTYLDHDVVIGHISCSRYSIVLSLPHANMNFYIYHCCTIRIDFLYLSVSCKLAVHTLLFVLYFMSALECLVKAHRVNLVLVK